MQAESKLRGLIQAAFKDCYQVDLPSEALQLNNTPSEFQGDYTLVTFPLVRWAKQKPEEIAQTLGQALLERESMLASFNVVKGFCNLSLNDGYWKAFLQQAKIKPNLTESQAQTSQSIVLEYASPNTNKPLHLGHLRNILLGYASAELLKASGHQVKTVQIINDRGIHICKSMLAWQRFGQGQTPQNSQTKGDHLVGQYYVRFEQAFQEEYQTFQQSPQAQHYLQTWLQTPAAQKIDTEKQSSHFFKEIFKNDYFNTLSELGLAAKKMLQDWEAQDPQVRQLWQTMNQWVYQGFDQTYAQLGVQFDKLYYESNTYLKGKQLVEDNLNQNPSIFYRKDDGSVWIDLSSVKLDQKVVLRADGTSMYITQDLGTALERFQDFNMNRMIYVVGDEQSYHFKVLFEILKRLGYAFSQNCQHLAYGMVNLTTGRMKSREGTVVDADDLMAQLIQSVRLASAERNTLEGLSPQAQAEIHEKVALAALKFYILKVEAKKTMVFDPLQSIDLQGQTGPYILNAYVRTQAVQRKAQALDLDWQHASYETYVLLEQERELLALVHRLPKIVAQAAEQLNPAELANYLYDLAKAYHRFWNDVIILSKEDLGALRFRIELSQIVAKALSQACALLGMEVVERM